MLPSEFRRGGLRSANPPYGLVANDPEQKSGFVVTIGKSIPGASRACHVETLGATLDIGGASYSGESMVGVSVRISRYVDAAQPGWVECRLVDALGYEHVFVEKVPVVTKAHLDAASSFPEAGHIACIVVDTNERDDGRQLVRIDTQKPWGIESTAGRSQFDVLSEQLCELPGEGADSSSIR